MSDLLSNCCAADFDPFGYEKENGVWQERCLKCGKLCEPIMLGEDDIANIRRCLKWNATTIDDKPEDGEREGACIFCGMRREDRQPCTGHIEHYFSREKRATSPKQDKPEKIELPKDTYPSKEMRVWMQSVTNWINNHEREE